MKITKAFGQFGELRNVCNAGTCPAAVLTDEGEVLFQGFNLTPEERALLATPAEEAFLKMPLATAKKLASQILNA